VPSIGIGATPDKRHSLAPDLTLLNGPSQEQMRPRISIVTLGVSDLERAVVFYRDGLGLPTQGIMGTEFEIGAVAFFELESGLKLALWPCSSLAADTGLPARPPSPTAFSLAHNVGSESEVDEVMEQARKAGARVVKRAQPAFWGGYAGYFQDPDGHLWEVVFNPDMASASQTLPLRDGALLPLEGQ
jgi:uncharacterized protein